jgi:7-cyano-7-deazaguanine synthase in queuosine biosynthesis
MKRLRDKYFSYYKEGNFLRYKQFVLERDILRIAYYIFEAEKTIKSNKTLDRLEIPLSEETYTTKNLVKLKDILEELLLLILAEDIEVTFTKINDVKGRVTKKFEMEKKEAICLFSGGVDSYAGISLAEEKYKNLIGLFVAHNDQVRIIKIVNDFKKKIKTQIRTIYAPAMESEGYSQFRGFLYILSGGVYASLTGAGKILVTECGPTMYQPLFSPYDSITYTTHPYVLKSAKEVLEILLVRKIDIITPFEDLTKAEVIANSNLKNFSETHSCITQRRGDHCGTCFGCVIKKLAENVAGVRGVIYNKNIFDLESDRDNIINVLEFSEKLITNPRRIQGFQREKMDEFEKWDLFKRYALDNLAGLMLGEEKGNDLFDRFITTEIIPLLAKRIKEVRANSFKPNFDKKVE